MILLSLTDCVVQGSFHSPLINIHNLNLILHKKSGGTGTLKYQEKVRRSRQAGFSKVSCSRRAISFRVCGARKV